jgi:NADPH:quinone reductase-like Zn-dependent oxidoreductase
MKAMVYQEYCQPENLEYREVPKPSPGVGEVLVKVQAASVNWIDWHFLTGTPFIVRMMAGLTKPKNRILGIDMAGIVEEVGKNVQEFSPGDAVFGTTDHGCFAEYICIHKEDLVRKPNHVSFEKAAAVPACASVAMQGLRGAGRIQSGQRVLINGASGGVGTFAVQLAIHFQTEVTGVCSSKNLDLVRDLGVDKVIDYTKQDFTKTPDRYDLIFDVAAKRSFSECKQVLKPGGIYVTTAFSPGLLLLSLLQSAGNNKMVPLLPKPPTQNDLLELKNLLNQGVITPVIDHHFPLMELPDAIRYLTHGHTRGKIVIIIPAVGTE